MEGTMEDEGPEDSGSTLVRSGKSALTFSEMAAFVHDLEARPPARLLQDLPGLMALPDAKFGLVTMVLRKKARPENAEAPRVLARLRELQAKSDDPAVRERCRSFLEKPED